MDRIGAAVWATGRAGRVIVEAGLTRPWLEFRGGIVYSPAKEGLDLGEACGLDVRLDAPVSMDIDAVLARPDIDVVFYAGLGSPDEVAAACLRANRAGKDAITIAGPRPSERRSWARRPPPSSMPARRAAGQRIVGTGFWDYLTITLPLASLSNVLTFEEIRLERVADMTLWGHGILRDEGHRRSDRGRRRRLHDAQLPRRGPDAARRVERPRARRAGLRERPGPVRRSAASGRATSSSPARSVATTAR